MNLCIKLVIKRLIILGCRSTKRKNMEVVSIYIWRQPATRQHNVMSQSTAILISFLVL